MLISIQRNQLSHVPGLDLVGDEARDAAFLIGDKTSEHGNQALVDLGPQLRIAASASPASTNILAR